MAMEEAPSIGDKSTSFEVAYRARRDPSRWCFDSGATSMCTGDQSIFENMQPCSGTLTVANDAKMPIVGRGVVSITLPNKTKARLGGVIYVPGLSENLLSLEALHLAGLESWGPKKGYKIMREGRIVATGKRIGSTTYLHSVKGTDALLVDAKKQKYIARFALSKESETAEKQMLIHSRLGHLGRRRFNHCVDNMDLSELKIKQQDRLLDDKCEICIRAKQVKKQNHNPVPRAMRPLQRVYMDFWGPNRDGAGEEKYYLSIVDDCTRYSWLLVTTDRRSENVELILESWT